MHEGSEISGVTGCLMTKTKQGFDGRSELTSGNSALSRNWLQLLLDPKLHFDCQDTTHTRLRVGHKNISRDIRLDRYHQMGDLDVSCPVLPCAYGESDLVNNDNGCNDMHLITTKSLSQLGGHFGCIPLMEFRLYTGHPVTWHSVPDNIQAHNLIRFSGVPNFWG